MSRKLFGSFDPTGRIGSAAVSRTAADQLAIGPLLVGFSGPPPRSSRLLCLFDGHLDNAAELALELGDGSVRGDPEVLLGAAYRRWGADLPPRLRGDFVLLVWDGERGEGLLVRDQLGARPAYLAQTGAVLRFGNDLQAMLGLLPRRPQPDAASLAHWVAASRRPGNATLYEGVERLGPGEMVVLDRDASRRVRYWEPRFEEPLDLTAEELAEPVREALRVAVGRRLAEAAPTAVLLSGGLDSSSVAAVATEVGTEVRACSACFPDHPAADEAPLIAQLRAELDLGGPVAEVRARSALASAVEHLGACGLPLLGWGDFWTVPLLREAAGEGVVNVLGGDGGDELFGPRQNLIADSFRALRPRRGLALAHELPGASPELPRSQVARMLASQAVTALPRRTHRLLARRLEERRRPVWLLPEARRHLAESDDPVAWKRLDGPLWWAETAYGIAYGLDEAGIFEHQRCRAALAGVEARHPLLDLDLVALCLRQQPAATLSARHSRPVLRGSVAGLVPDPVRLRPAKARFESLLVSCLTGPDMPALRKLLLDPGAEVRAAVDQEAMRRELFEGGGEVVYGSFAWMWLIWRLATAELWLRTEAAGGHAPTTFFPLDSSTGKVDHPV